MNTDPYHPLPLEVQSELDHAELAETLEAWQLSEWYCSQEPPLDEFRQMGTGMWPVIEEATRPRLTRVFIWQPCLACLSRSLGPHASLWSWRLGSRSHNNPFP